MQPPSPRSLRAWQRSKSSKALLGKSLLVLPERVMDDRKPLVSLASGFTVLRLSGTTCLKVAGRGTLEEMGVPLPRGFRSTRGRAPYLAQSGMYSGLPLAGRYSCRAAGMIQRAISTRGIYILEAGRVSKGGGHYRYPHRISAQYGCRARGHICPCERIPVFVLFLHDLSP